jgi:hypothetical protein
VLHFMAGQEHGKGRPDNQRQRTWSAVNFFLQYLNNPPSSPFVSSTHASSYLRKINSTRVHPRNKRWQRVEKQAVRHTSLAIRRTSHGSAKLTPSCTFQPWMGVGRDAASTCWHQELMHPLAFLRQQAPAAQLQMAALRVFQQPWTQALDRKTQPESQWDSERLQRTCEGASDQQLQADRRHHRWRLL